MGWKGCASPSRDRQKRKTNATLLFTCRKERGRGGIRHQPWGSTAGKREHRSALRGRGGKLSLLSGSLVGKVDPPQPGKQDTARRGEGEGGLPLQARKKKKRAHSPERFNKKIKDKSPSRGKTKRKRCAYCQRGPHPLEKAVEATRCRRFPWGGGRKTAEAF